MDLSDTLPYIDITYFQLVMAVIVLVIGFLIAKIVIYVIKKTLKRTKLPPLLVNFLGRIFSILFYVAIILAVASSLGMDVGSYILGLSAIIGLVLAFGMQNTLKNVISGMWIATIRPFRQDEHVVINNLEGTVNAVGIMSTELLKPDNTFITIPNGLVWDSPIINYSRMKNRRVDIQVGTSYSGDIDKAIEVGLRVMNENDLVLNEPAPAVTVNELGDSSVNLVLKAWTLNENYWGLKNDLTKEIFKEYTKEGIEIPYPQMDVHMEE